MTPSELIEWVWPIVVSAVVLLAAVTAGLHAVLYKRDARAAVAWVGLIVLVPALGAVLYLLFGINRIRRRAKTLRDREGTAAKEAPACTPEGPQTAGLGPLVQLVDKVTSTPLTEGNAARLLKNGDETFPAMLAAIDAAEHHVHLSTYIFDRDATGLEFAEVLGRARARGVEVRVLIDAVGARYSLPSVISSLRDRGVSCARFMPSWIPWRVPYMNLRNHRKLLVIDGKVGFTGGLNIREGNMLTHEPKHPIRDLHVEVAGPAVAHLQRCFLEDWAFSTAESPSGEAYFPAPERAGEVCARGINDGPDEHFEVLRHVLLGALSVARERVQILTPYFVPDSALITALGVAAMRGVEVEIVLPEENNLSLVKWASTATLWQVLERGCRVYMSAGVFDHTKLMIVDGRWTLLGSANWDARSLRLNFEFNLECYDSALAQAAAAIVQSRKQQARELSLAEIDGRPLPTRVRDGVARLLTPYL